jgi:hypothetical protein
MLFPVTLLRQLFQQFPVHGQDSPRQSIIVLHFFSCETPWSSQALHGGAVPKE